MSILSFTLLHMTLVLNKPVQCAVCRYNNMRNAKYKYRVGLQQHSPENTHTNIQYKYKYKQHERPAVKVNTYILTGSHFRAPAAKTHPSILTAELPVTAR